MEFKSMITEALARLILHRNVLYRALLWPLAVIVITDVGLGSEHNAIFTALLEIIGLLGYLYFAIVVHRVVLLGPDAVSRWGIVTWTKRETLFLLHLIGIVVPVIPLVVLNQVSVWVTLIAACGYFYLTMRISLVFPGIAIGKKFSFHDSWKMTASYNKLMFLAALVVPIITALPFGLLSRIPFSEVPLSILSCVVLALDIAVLSVVFRYISEKQSPPVTEELINDQ